jgi:hypothetical protein
VNRAVLPKRQTGRNYEARPYQAGGRTSSTYGNTRLGAPDDFNPKRGTIRLFLLCVGLACLLPFLACVL